MRTQNLCFGAKIRKIYILLHTPVLLYKSGVRGYTFHGRFPDGDPTVAGLTPPV